TASSAPPAMTSTAAALSATCTEPHRRRRATAGSPVPVVMEQRRHPTAGGSHRPRHGSTRRPGDGVAGDHPLLRSLADLARRLDHPGGRIGQAYWLSEWLDC